VGRRSARILRAVLVAAALLSPGAPVAGDEDVREMRRQVAGDVAKRLARWKPVPMPFSEQGFSDRERRLLSLLIDASRDLENIYWRQSDPGAIPLYRSLSDAASPDERALRRLLWINGSRYDLIDRNRPFVGNRPMPPGRALYPEGLAREDIERYVAKHPDQRQAIYSPFTVIRRKGDALEAVPYHEAYRAWLEPAARKLSDAAALSDDPKFARYLSLRARALETDDYYESDSAWLDLDSPRIDLIFAPYETYLDDLLGVKTSYGAAVLVRNDEESRRMAIFRKYVPRIQEALPMDPRDRPSLEGRAAPMEVMDSPFRAGDLRHGYQAVADNLPNDPRIHEEKGSKRIFFKNFMDARVREVILPVARKVMRDDQAARASAEGYLTVVMMHEISHGLGPAFARSPSGRRSIREAIGPTFSALEEAKADAVGMFALAWMIDRGGLPRERLAEYDASYLAGIFRTVRFGVAEAHGRAEMMEFHYLSERGAIRREPSGRYAVDGDRIREAIAALAKELLEIEATGDRSRAESLFATRDGMPPELARALESAADVPVDVDPQVPFPEGVE
jgi:hypothetical protein